MTPSLIRSLVENDKADEFVRCAALKTLLTQMVLREITRDEVVAYYQSLFREGLERKASPVWDDLVWYSTDIYPAEVIEDIRLAYKDGLIDTTWISLDEVEETLESDKESVLNKLYSDSRYRFIENLFEDINWWSYFTHSKQSEDAVAKQYEPAAFFND